MMVKMIVMMIPIPETMGDWVRILKIDWIEKLSSIPEKKLQQMIKSAKFEHNWVKGKRERERAEEWTGLMPFYPIHSKLSNLQYFGKCTVISLYFNQLSSNFQNLLIFYQVTSTTFQSYRFRKFVSSLL